MRKVLGRTPEEKRTKSRSGCKNCKLRRIKCDETIPSCYQCKRRNVECPGYPRVLTWSTKHEKLLKDVKCPTETTYSIVETVFRASIPTVNTAGPVARAEPDIDRNARSGPNPASTLISMPSIYQSWAPLTYEYDELPAFYDYIFGMNHDKNATYLSSFPQPSYMNPRNVSETDSIKEPIEVECQSMLDTDQGSDPVIKDKEVLPLSRACDAFSFHGLTLYDPLLALQYYDETICTHLCVYDTVSNPLRNSIMANGHGSSLYSALLRYVTASYLENQLTPNQKHLVLEDARKDTLFHLETELGVNTARKGRAEKVTRDNLLALIIFGLTYSWDGANNTGVQHYREAISLYERISINMVTKDRRFFSETLAYWWTGLAFVTHTEEELLPDPPHISLPIHGSRDRAPKQAILYPHPLTGISPQSHILLGKVGALIYAQRSFIHQSLFLTSSRLKQQEQALQASIFLEEELLSLQMPPPTAIRVSSGSNTSFSDMHNTAESFRLCGLLLLYRCFPDLLANRFAGDISEGKDSTENWLLSLALHILDTLNRNGAKSGTRSTEQILLVIIAGELRLPPRSQYSMCPLTLQDEEYSLDMPALEAILEDASSLSEIISLPSLLTPLCDEDLESEVDVRNVVQRVQNARTRLCERLAAIRSILPYKSVEQAEELIFEVWRKSDAGEEVFWMDVMIKNGWKFVMV